MPITIDVWTDIVCPWCFIGVERLERVVTEMGADVTIRHRPFQLDPSTPREGRNIREWLSKKYGRDPAPMFAHVERAARESGLALDLSKQPMAYPTLDAHTLISRAKTPREAHRLARALFHAYFMEGKNIADSATLASIAAPFGFTPDETLATLADETALSETREAVAGARRLGIQGVPLFLFDEELALSGAQPVEALRSAIERTTTTSAPPVEALRATES